MPTLSSVAEEARKDKLYQEPGADSNKTRIMKIPDKNGFFTASCRLGNKANIPPSSKLTMAMAVILEWREKFPNDKIIGKPLLHRSLLIRSSAHLSL